MLQLLPCVVEVIRWYDMTLLTELCDAHFTGQTMLLNYGMSLAVKYSMCHAADLLMMLHCSSHLWQVSLNNKPVRMTARKIHDDDGLTCFIHLILPCHENPLAGSTYVHGPTTGYSFSLLCLVVLTD